MDLAVKVRQSPKIGDVDDAKEEKLDQKKQSGNSYRIKNRVRHRDYRNRKRRKTGCMNTGKHRSKRHNSEEEEQKRKAVDMGKSSIDACRPSRRTNKKKEKLEMKGLR